MARRLVTWLAVAVLVGIPAHGFAGAWLLDKGRTSMQVTSTFTYGDHGFDDDGNLVEVPTYRKFTLQGRYERGFLPWLTGIVVGELRDETVDREVDDVILPDKQSFGAIAGGARVRVWEQANWIFSAELTAGSGGFDTYGKADQSDSPHVEARALVGYGTKVFDRNVFAEVQGGYVAKTDPNVADEIKLDVTVGARILPRWQVIAQSFTTVEVGGDLDRHYTKASGSVVYTWKPRVKVEMTALGTIHGRNALREMGGKVGFWYTF